MNIINVIGALFFIILIFFIIPTFMFSLIGFFYSILNKNDNRNDTKVYFWFTIVTFIIIAISIITELIFEFNF